MSTYTKDYYSKEFLHRPALDKYFWFGTYTEDASYGTGGTAPVVADFDGTTAPATSIDFVQGGTSQDGTVLYEYLASSGKIVAYNTADGLEVTATTDLSAATKSCKLVVTLS